MIQIFKLFDCPESPWKNGRGKTRQIDIFPEGSIFSKNDFLWRLSSASILSSDPFSQFSEYDRLLIVWKGDGLILNDRPILTHTPFYFRGEDQIFCELINDKVIDLGLIYKRSQIKAHLETISLGNETIKFSLTNSLQFYFFAQGEKCTINKHDILPGDIIKIEDEKEIMIESDSSSLFYKFTLSFL